MRDSAILHQLTRLIEPTPRTCWKPLLGKQINRRCRRKFEMRSGLDVVRLRRKVFAVPLARSARSGGCQMNCKTYFQFVFGLLILSTVANGQIASSAQAASAAAASAVIPTPSGPYSIGRQGYDLTDRSRADPFSSRKNQHRKLMVYIWYPVHHTKGQSTGEYVPRARQLDNNADAKAAAQNSSAHGGR